MNLQSRPREELQALMENLQKQYETAKQSGFRLDMSRGKPNADQTALSAGMLRLDDTVAEDGTDCGNYGGPNGIPEARRLMASLLDAEPDDVFIGGSSSLNLMHDLMTYCWLFPLPGADLPWCRQEKPKFLCLTPGYDRHFAVSQHLGLELVSAPMTATGPDMDIVEQLVGSDASIKGMWCVPKYSNPTGVTYSDDTVRRLAALKPAAKDFRIFWDNAYAVHNLDGEGDRLLPFLPELRRCGNEDIAFLFASTAKITLPGAGISAVAASGANLGYIRKHMGFQTICFDKLNQLRHARFFAKPGSMAAHMERHAAILRPKFAMVLDTLARELDGLGVAEWQSPRGGYFVSIDVLPGCAKRVVQLCKDAGVVFTPAGATHPYGVDPDDRTIRVAPTFPTPAELAPAMELFCLCVKLAAVERLLA